MCDIDHFKQVNDQRGHAAGDEVLQQFACRAQKFIRTNSDWIARYGGEEFLIVLPETPHDGAVLVAEKIRHIVAASPFATRAGETAGDGELRRCLHRPQRTGSVAQSGYPDSRRRRMPVPQQTGGAQSLERARNSPWTCRWRRTASMAISRPGAVRR